MTVMARTLIYQGFVTLASIACDGEIGSLILHGIAFFDCARGLSV